jgi:hypothetical protein
LKEGGIARLTTARGIPGGSFVKLRPHSQAFLDVAQAIGPKVRLRAAALRLSAGDECVELLV